MLRPKIVMAVYNPLEYDGRVKRSCEALAAVYDVKLLCVRGVGEEQATGYEVTRVRLPTDLPAPFRLAWFWLLFIRFAWKEKPVIVYAHDFFLSLPGLLAATFSHAASVYDAHELIIPDQGRSQTAREWLFYVCEKLSIKCHHVVIAANAERAALMQEWYGLRRAPIAVLNVVASSVGTLTRTQVLASFPTLLRVPGDVIAVYAGDINFDRGLRPIIEAYLDLPSHHKLALIGSGPDLEEVRRFAKSKAEDRILIIGRLPQKWLQDVMAVADIGIITYSMEGLNNLYCSPNKVFEYAHAGLAIVATGQPPLVSLVNGYDIGAIVSPDIPEAARGFAEAILRVSTNLPGYKSHLPAFLEDHDLSFEQRKVLDAVATVH